MYSDIVLVSLIAAVVTSFLHLIMVAVTMCQRYPSKMTILVGTIFLFFGSELIFFIVNIIYLFPFSSQDKNLILIQIAYSKSRHVLHTLALCCVT